MSTRLRLTAAPLLALLLAAPVAACGEQDGSGSVEPTAEETSDPATEPSSEPATPSEPIPSSEPSPTGSAGRPIPVTGTAGVERALLVSASEAGGEVSPLAFPLESPQERQDFAATFDRGALGDEVAQAARSLDRPDTTAWGAVVALACEGPASVRIDAGEAGYEVTPSLKKSTVQCLVPVTYVVVFAAPAAG